MAEIVSKTVEYTDGDKKVTEVSRNRDLFESNQNYNRQDALRYAFDFWTTKTDGGTYIDAADIGVETLLGTARHFLDFIEGRPFNDSDD